MDPQLLMAETCNQESPGIVIWESGCASPPSPAAVALYIHNMIIGIAELVMVYFFPDTSGVSFATFASAGFGETGSCLTKGALAHVGK